MQHYRRICTAEDLSVIKNVFVYWPSTSVIVAPIRKRTSLKHQNRHVEKSFFELKMRFGVLPRETVRNFISSSLKVVEEFDLTAW